MAIGAPYAKLRRSKLSMLWEGGDFGVWQHLNRIRPAPNSVPLGCFGPRHEIEGLKTGIPRMVAIPGLDDWI